MGNGFSISPYTGQNSIATLPRRENVPQGKEGWELTTCKICGAECWRNVPLLNQVKEMNPNIEEMCTLCALKESSKR